MHRPILLASGFILTALVYAARVDSQELRDSTELARLEVEWNEAHLRGDPDVLDRLWAEDLIVTVPSMRAMSKAESLAFARSGRMRFQRYETSSLQIRIHGDAAIVTGQLDRVRELHGRMVEDYWQFTKVYTRQDGNWRVVAFHASTVPR